ncbi:MAG: hypothetical protein ABI743_08425, partial [bacterium]
GADGGIDGGAWFCMRIADEENDWTPGAGDLLNLTLDSDLQPIVDAPKLVVYYPGFVRIVP